MAKRLLLANPALAGAAYGANIYNAGGVLRAGYSKPAALRRGGFGPVAGPANFLRGAGQGACAGLLMLIGVMHLTTALPEGQPTLAGLATYLGTLFYDPATAEGGLTSGGIATAIETILAGGLPGVLEIMGAVALFLNAGRGVAKILGLLGFIAIVAAHANGVTHDDLIEKLTGFVENAQEIVASLEAFTAN